MKIFSISEGAVKLQVPQAKRIYDAPVFYNPVMRLNRDISVLIAKVLKFRSAVDLLAATGIRGLRLKKEAGVQEVYINDVNPDAVKLIKKNAKLNKVSVHTSNLRAHEFLATRWKLKHAKFDYVDVDPFGTPVPFLDAAVKALNPNGGVIGVTATDTAALCGSAPAACLRKYGSKPLRNYLMHELGIRILLKKVIEVGAQYDLALTPIFCHATQHYMRVYLKADEGAGVTDDLLKNIGPFQGAGPMWLGPLWDEKLVEQIHKLSRTSRLSHEISLRKAESKRIAKEFGVEVPTKFDTVYDTEKLLFTIRGESKIPTFGFFELAEFKLGQVPRIHKVVEKLQEKGYKAARTHFSGTGIRTDANLSNFLKVTKALIKIKPD